MAQKTDKYVADFDSFKKLVTNMPMIFYVIDKNWIFKLSEGLGLQKLGLTPGQVVGASAKEMYKDFPHIIAGLTRAFNGEKVRVEHQLGDLYLDNFIVPLYNSYGQIEGVTGAAIDITEAKKTRQDLDRTMTLQKALIDSIPGLLYLYTSDGELEFWNKSHETITGYNAEELKKMKLLDWYKDDPESQNAVLKGLENIAVTGFGEAEALLQCKDGSVRPFYFTACPLNMDNKDYFVGIGVDISTRVKAQQELRDLNSSLEIKVKERTEELNKTINELSAKNEELNQTNIKISQMQNFLVESEKMSALGGLVAGVAHEVNTPIGIGVTAASHLSDISTELFEKFSNETLDKNDALPFLDEIREASDIILKNLTRASKLIRSFKQLSVDQSDEPKRIFKVKSYINEILLSLSPSFKSRNIHIDVSCPEDLKFDSYPGALAQIITNLVMNSLHHAFDSGVEGYIHINLEMNDNTPVLHYSDDGKGMSNETLSHIFEPFFTTNRNDGGSGLGLSVVYTLVTQRFMGKIHCESEKNKGSSFIIQLSPEVIYES